MTDPTPEEDLRSTGLLGSCGVCGNTSEALTLLFECPIHGQLADWAADNADPKVVAKVTDTARAHERAAASWAEATGALADLFDRASKALRRDRT